MRGLAILPPPPNDASPLFEHVCATVLQQSHLCPVPLEFQVSGQAQRAGLACVTPHRLVQSSEWWRLLFVIAQQVPCAQ